MRRWITTVGRDRSRPASARPPPDGDRVSDTRNETATGDDPEDSRRSRASSSMRRQRERVVAEEGTLADIPEHEGDDVHSERDRRARDQRRQTARVVSRGARRRRPPRPPGDGQEQACREQRAPDHRDERPARWPDPAEASPGTGSPRRPRACCSSCRSGRRPRCQNAGEPSITSTKARIAAGFRVAPYRDKADTRRTRRSGRTPRLPGGMPGRGPPARAGIGDAY